MLWIICIVCAALSSSAAAAEEIDLSIHESSFYSPSGEDGVMARIFSLIKPETHYCVEFGAADGISDSLTYLLRNQGWRGVLFDRAFDIQSINLYREFITKDNINDLLQKYFVPEIFDLAVFDTGYNDFYLWHALDNRYKPALVCIVYNGHYKPFEDKVVVHHPYFAGDSTNYFGASILALYRLGRSKGYSLIYAEESGRHLFFLRDDIFQKYPIAFKDMNDVAKLYRPAVENPQGNIGMNAKNRTYITSEQILNEE